MRRALAACGLVLTVVWLGVHPRAAGPVTYRLSFPSPEHHWMLVEATFPDIGSAPLDLRFSRSSPGRYALHDFVKNVYDVRAYDAEGREIAAAPTDAHGWRVERHGGAVRVSYKVFGDRVDGTYLAVDPTHAHVNMPAAIMFARGLDDRAAAITFVPPPGREHWQVATQLLPGDDPRQFIAPNLQYLMDSPAEFGAVSLRSFDLDGHTFRVAVHHDGTDADLDRFVTDVRTIVAEQRAIFGEYPAHEPGHYTFLADYLPYASGDGMEHRNSTVLTSPSAIRTDRPRLLATLSHEFFHNWNVERIRPRSLEPFDFESANVSGELWLAEGFTQYYGTLALARAGLEDLQATATTFAGVIGAVSPNPARLVRSAEAMSRMAVFTDGGRTVDRTNWASTYISYYPYGAAIALALDLTLRERSDGRVTLDEFMRAMWRQHGRPGGTRPGYVDRPYTLADVEQCLADVTGAPGFAREFLARYVTGHEAPDYETLLRHAGLLLRRLRPTAPWLGQVRIERGPRGARLEGATIPGTPLHDAGLDRGDEIVEVEGRRIETEDDLLHAVAGRAPGQAVRLRVADRGGAERAVTLTLAADPAFEVVPAEAAGRPLSAAQRAFRRHWLGSKQ